jgi:hypothetical protein
MEKNDFWWYAIPFSLGVIVSLTLTWYGHYERTSSEQAVEEPAVKVTKTVTTENMKTDVPVGKIKCTHKEHHHNFCTEYVIYRTIGE